MFFFPGVSFHSCCSILPCNSERNLDSCVKIHLCICKGHSRVTDSGIWLVCRTHCNKMQYIQYIQCIFKACVSGTELIQIFLWVCFNGCFLCSLFIMCLLCIRIGVILFWLLFPALNITLLSSRGVWRVQVAAARPLIQMNFYSRRWLLCKLAAGQHVM